MPSTVEAVLEEFGTPSDPRSHQIPRERLLTFSNSHDLEVLGALYLCLSDTSLRARISPAFKESEFVDFLLHYFARCIEADPKGEFAHGRYEAQWDLVGIFRNAWHEDFAKSESCQKVKKFLAEQYIRGSEDVRISIITGSLEHLFEVKAIADYFQDWLETPALSGAFREAIKLARRQGTKSE